MNLSEIIKTNESKTTTILTSEIFKYKKSLLTYYKAFFCEEPILLIDSIFNTCSYAKIVPASEFTQAICDLLEVNYIIEDETEEGFSFDTFAQYETINFNSIFLKDL